MCSRGSLLVRREAARIPLLVSHKLPPTNSLALVDHDGLVMGRWFADWGCKITLGHNGEILALLVRVFSQLMEAGMC